MSAALPRLEATLRELEARRDVIEGEHRLVVAAADARRRDALAELAIDMLGTVDERGLLRERHGTDERPGVDEDAAGAPRKTRAPRRPRTANGAT